MQEEDPTGHQLQLYELSQNQSFSSLMVQGNGSLLMTKLLREHKRNLSRNQSENKDVKASREI